MIEREGNNRERWGEFSLKNDGERGRIFSEIERERGTIDREMANSFLRGERWRERENIE